MRFRKGWWVPLSAAMLLVGTSAHGASGPVRISVAFTEAELTDVIAALEEVAGRQISLVPFPRAGHTVSIRFEKESISNVLHAILGPLGYSWSFKTPSIDSLGFTSVTRLVIKTVEPKSSAHRAGLAPGDIILRVNDNLVETRAQAAGVLRPLERGARLQVMRHEGNDLRVFEAFVEQP